YYLEDRVEAWSCGSGVHAEVEGAAAEPYEVELHVDGARLRAWCSCPFAAGGEPCKHMWAVSLAADAEGLVRVTWRRPMAVVVEGESDGEVEAGSAPRVARIRRRPAAPAFVRQQARAQAPPDWRAAISMLADRVAAAAPVMGSPPYTLEYVLDVDGSERGVGVQIYRRLTREDGQAGERRAVGVDTALSSELGRGPDRAL